MPDEKELFKAYRPKQYTVEVEIGPNDGDQKTGSITVSTRPIVVRYIKHQIVKDGGFPNRPVQDGLYRVDWSIAETQRYFAGPPPMADAAFGTVRTGIWKPLDPPLEIRDTLAISVRVINAWGPRTAPFTVQVIFEGYEKHMQTEGVL